MKMKWIKKFEAKRKVQNLHKVDDASKKTEYLEKCQDIDEMSYISFDSFYKSLDFDIFSKHDYNKFYSSGIAIHHDVKSATYGQIDGVYISSSEYGRSDHYLKDLVEWQKRNAFLFAEVNTGGASGGSCWDGMPGYEDSGPREYYGSSLDLHEFIYSYLKPIFDSILNNYANDKSSTELCDILYNNPNIIKEDDRSNYEYYGNYDNYSAYYITLGDLFEFLLKNGSF